MWFVITDGSMKIMKANTTVAISDRDHHMLEKPRYAPGSDQIHRETGTSRLAAVDLLIRSTTGNRTPSSVCTRRADEFDTNGIYTTSTCVTLNGSGIQLAVGSQPLRLRNHNFGLTHRIMVKRLETSPHDPLGITDSACKNQSVMVSVQYGPFNTYIPIRSTIIGKSRVARDPITMHTSWRSNSDITSITSARAKRCRINLCKRHRFAIATSKCYLLMNSSLCKLPADPCDCSLKSSAEYLNTTSLPLSFLHLLISSCECKTLSFQLIYATSFCNCQLQIPTAGRSSLLIHSTVASAE
ncbi:hypothetical protein F511_33182 [Dorcoceras hygrometricum]|uniref:Uncharacterized protein n=1 Tax=Dorcoceras hygrometricum TaxID=472368 RepID=A0A2Z7C3J6_9LAMI|nr:hypothetical protein F511_33182 [Dorcoceras hygrometricum]